MSAPVPLRIPLPHRLLVLWRHHLLEVLAPFAVEGGEPTFRCDSRSPVARRRRRQDARLHVTVGAEHAPHMLAELTDALLLVLAPSERGVIALLQVEAYAPLTRLPPPDALPTPTPEST